MAVAWSYFDKFKPIIDKYMPKIGQGETMASQIVTAVNKLVYKWYNDGDVFDNQNIYSCGNDLSDYANWLDKNAKGTNRILKTIENIKTEADYEDLLKELADLTLNEQYLFIYEDEQAQGDIYNCRGQFVFLDEDDDYNEWYNDDEDEEEFDWDY